MLGGMVKMVTDQNEDKVKTAKRRVFKTGMSKMCLVHLRLVRLG